MPLTYNSNSPIRIKYNGNEVRKVKWTVWEGGKGKNKARFWQNTYIDISGIIKNANSNGMTYPLFVNSNEQVTGSLGSFSTMGFAVFENFDGTTLSNMLFRVGSTSTAAYPYIASQDCYCVFWFNQGSSNPAVSQETFDEKKAQVEFGSATSYEPYENIPTVWRLLPEEYTEVEWLQSDGACYIDTNRVPNMDDIIEQKFMSLNTTSSVCSWYGSMPASSIVKPRFSMGISTNGFFVGANNTNGYESLDNEIHIVKWQQITDSIVFMSVDGTESTRSASGGYDPVVELTSYLFARHGNSGVQIYDGEGTRIYYHKEYLSNGTIQLDLVPVIRNSDNELGMYDLVNKVFYTNAGSGTFSKGPDVT